MAKHRGFVCFGAPYRNLNPYYLKPSNCEGESTQGNPLESAQLSTTLCQWAGIWGYSVTSAGELARFLYVYRSCMFSKEGFLLGS